jgi:hypothetical protein
MNDITYIGLDVHKTTVCVAVAETRTALRSCASWQQTWARAGVG